MIFQSRYIFYI